jgi:hypothetical protein
MVQIENEYGDTEQAYGAGGKPYAMWAASMAIAQNTGIPWIMCQQYDAPDPVVSLLHYVQCSFCQQLNHEIASLHILSLIFFYGWHLTQCYISLLTITNVLDGP